MSYTYDDQLIDAVAVRRRRLAGALMFGEHRLRREWQDRLRTFAGSALLAAVIAAGCVATSFVQQLFAENPLPGSPSSSVPGPSSGAGPRAR